MDPLAFIVASTVHMRVKYVMKVLGLLQENAGISSLVAVIHSEI